MKIERLEVRIVDQPTRVHRTMARGPVDTGAPGSAHGKPILLKLYAGGGLTAFGQIRAPTPFFGESTHSVFAAVGEYYGPALLGESIFDLERISEKCDDLLPENACARAVLDYTLHDAMGKALGVPAYQLLGGVYHVELPLEWSVGMGSSDQMVAEALRAVEQFGLRTICLKVGGRNTLADDVANVRAVREAIGPGRRLGIDANATWDAHTAIRTVRALEAFDLAYVEQPVARNDFAGLRRVRDAVGTPVMADESVMTMRDAAELARLEAVDVFVLKTYKLGGIRSAKRIATLAEAGHIRVNIGGTAVLSQLEAAVGAHLYTSTRGVFPSGEFVFGLGVWGPDPIAYAEGFTVRDGVTRAPTGPGLGVTVDEAAVERLTLARRVVE